MHITSRYTKALTIIERRFFETLFRNPTLGLLAACMDQDPDNRNHPIRRFYLLCRERYQGHRQHCCALVRNQIF